MPPDAAGLGGGVTGAVAGSNAAGRNMAGANAANGGAGSSGVGGEGMDGGGTMAGSSTSGEVSSAAGASSPAAGASQGGSFAGSGLGGAMPVGPRLVGRFDTSDPGAAVFAWSGAAIAARFSANSLAVTLTDTGANVFAVVLDGKLSVLATQAGRKTYPLASGLVNGVHDILLYRRTEASLGETSFHGFDLLPAAYLSSPAPTRRIEVIGDSISAGYGNDGSYPCAFSAATENHYLTYGAIAARSLQAELYTEAWSGIGMFRNADAATVGTMPERYPRTLPNRATSRWDFAQFVPQAVVVNLGTNDFAKGDPGAAFQDAYTQFVRDLRGHYPSARFYLAVGPMLGKSDYDRATGYANAVIAARSAAGDGNLALLPFGVQDFAQDGIGCDYHPSLKTHQKMADKTIAALKTDLGW